MEGLYQIFDYMQKEGVISNVEVGRVRKNQILIIKRGLDKLKETDHHKYNLAKKLVHLYFVFDKIPGVPLELNLWAENQDKYGWGLFHDYLNHTLNSIATIISDIIEAFANDEKLDTYSRYAMNPTMENFKEFEDELVEDLNLGKYYICGGGVEDDGLKYITLFPEKGKKEPEVHIPVPFKYNDEEWCENVKKINMD